MKSYEVESHLINDEVLTQVVEAESRYAALEAIYQSFRHASDGFVQFEDEWIIFLDHVVYVKAFEIVE
ncbi:hypothetical protein EVJ22_05960 [Exiguobacterium sp. SH0S7]|uniref:hypothetical protein n=1 Tax=Exiguobacterium sp. SH0S7 TaxID=2510951 RepID=UPI00103E69F3|nr:hypothetical protein [Exiguobacterium sp. SH0S7]TCI72201.1 hypothetical protein EVJ22_05960 [Exiguobacterium sp. SH0S7]